MVASRLSLPKILTRGPFYAVVKVVQLPVRRSPRSYSTIVYGPGKVIMLKPCAMDRRDSVAMRSRPFGFTDLWDTASLNSGVTGRQRVLGRSLRRSGGR